MHRSALVDSLKALMSQLIVLHHLSIYAPMAAWIAPAWPALTSFISQDGRLAVQPFLVMAGYLAAHSLHGRRTLPVGALVRQRYLRLAPPLALALLGVVAATWLVGADLAGQDWVSPLPSLATLLAHLLFLQDLLGIESISAGAWYVAIDLQLFALAALLAWLCTRSGRALADSRAPAVVALGTAASAWVFSRQPTLDVWAIYFLSAYGLGALAAWGQLSPRARRWWWAALMLVLLEWLSAPRERPLWAMATALALYGSTHLPGLYAAWPGLRRAVEQLSDLSYSLFVCHFAMIVLISGLWIRWHAQGQALAWLAVALVWGLSLACAAVVQALCARLWKRWPARRESNPRPTA